MKFKDLKPFLLSLGFKAEVRPMRGICKDDGSPVMHEVFVMDIPRGEIEVDITTESYGVVYLYIHDEVTKKAPALLNVKGHRGCRAWNYWTDWQEKGFKRQLIEEIEFWKTEKCTR